MKKALILAAFSLAHAVSASPIPHQKHDVVNAANELQSADALFVLLNARLMLMRSVALAKWRSGGAIEDRERERIVLHNARDRAAREGLQNIDARTRTQIEMAKEIQRFWHRRWAREGLDGREIALPLSTIRAQLEALDAQILAALSRALPGCLIRKRKGACVRFFCDAWARAHFPMHSARNSSMRCCKYVSRGKHIREEDRVLDLDLAPKSHVFNL